MISFITRSWKKFLALYGKVGESLSKYCWWVVKIISPIQRNLNKEMIVRQASTTAKWSNLKSFPRMTIRQRKSKNVNCTLHVSKYNKMFPATSGRQLHEYNGQLLATLHSSSPLKSVCSCWPSRFMHCCGTCLLFFWPAMGEQSSHINTSPLGKQRHVTKYFVNSSSNIFHWEHNWLFCVYLNM